MNKILFSLLLIPMEEPVKSPCRNICKYNQHRICVGCLRSLDEIMRWPKMSNDERRQVLAKTEERKQDQSGMAFYDGYYF